MGTYIYKIYYFNLLAMRTKKQKTKDKFTLKIKHINDYVNKN